MCSFPNLRDAAGGARDALAADPDSLWRLVRGGCEAVRVVSSVAELAEHQQLVVRLPRLRAHLAHLLYRHHNTDDANATNKNNENNIKETPTKTETRRKQGGDKKTRGKGERGKREKGTEDCIYRGGKSTESKQVDYNIWVNFGKRLKPVCS